MTTNTADIQTAFAQHRAGQFAAAERMYRDILRVDPGHAEALHLLGLIAHQAGNTAAAVELISRAIEQAGLRPIMASNLGAAYQSQGAHDDAVAMYRQAIAAQPDFLDAHHNLATALAARGDYEEAVRSYEHVLNSVPNHPTARNNLGKTFVQLGRLEDAVVCFRRALEDQPLDIPIWMNLGTALGEQGKLDDAANCFENVLRQAPDNAQAHYNLGHIRQDQDRSEEAANCYRKAVELNPTYRDAWNNLGIVLKSLKRLDEAESCFRRLLEEHGDCAILHFNLGNILRAQDRNGDAAESYRRALQIHPEHVESYLNLGLALTSGGHIQEAEQQFRTAMAIRPQFIESYINLSSSMQLQGRLDEAVAIYREAQQIDPNCEVIHGNPLMLKLYQPNVLPEDIFQEHRLWAARFSERLPGATSFPNSRETERRLRIGYVSADFRVHSVGFFIETILKNHDHSQFEITCYSECSDDDHVTDRMRPHADHWYNTFRKSDEDVARRIRDDGIDILIDLSGHTSGNRLLVFGRKPAPIQMTYLGYGTTTGLTAVDYRLTDAVADPPGETDYYTEELLRLPVGILCYSPPENVPAVSELPLVKNNFVTFGSFNALIKLSDETISLWARILNTVPDSRLILKNRSIADSGIQRRITEKFAEQGVAAHRVELLGPTKTIAEHLELYDRIDIGLDPLPYNGATTTCEALWMGIPVVTLRGKAFVGRMTASVLTRVGLESFIAETRDDYVNLAEWWALSAQRLQVLRGDIRKMVANSPLCDQLAYVRGLESAYRDAWRQWCAEDSSVERRRAGEVEQRRAGEVEQRRAG